MLSITPWNSVIDDLVLIKALQRLSVSGRIDVNGHENSPQSDS